MKSYCHNLFCRKSDRRFICTHCNTLLCGKCAIHSIPENKYYCPDCYFIYSEDFNNTCNEWADMINDLFPKKDIKNIDINKSVV